MLAINFGGQNSTNGLAANIVVNGKIGATFLLTRNYCNVTVLRGLVQMLTVLAMNVGGRNSSNGDDTNLVVNGNMNPNFPTTSNHSNSTA